MTSKIKEIFAKYGLIAICIQMGVCALWFVATYGLVKAGYDYKTLAPKLGLDPNNEIMSTSSDVAIAYILYKAMAPIRIPIIIVAIPCVARLIKYKPKED